MTIDLQSGYLFRAYAAIDLDAIRQNIQAIQANLKRGTQILAVLKTDGYGHGAKEIAHALSDLVCGYGVATPEEALSLRENGAGWDKMVLVLGYVPQDLYEDMIAHHISMDVYSLEVAKELSACAERMGEHARLHFKLDTGMGRLGVPAEEQSLMMLKQITELPGIYIEGIFTHFLGSDMADQTSVREQLSSYESFIEKAEEMGIHIPIKHCANSAAALDLPEADFDMVRAGIAIYGLYPSDERAWKVPLKPALEVKSHVIMVKDVPEGHGISYGSTYHVPKGGERIATIPIGYGDGYPRALSNQGYVLIHGKKAPIRGRICMDQFMVGVSEIPDVRVGDEVTLVGRDGNASICVEELCKIIGNTFSYEFVCGLGKRISRVYFRDKKAVSVRSYKEML